MTRRILHIAILLSAASAALTGCLRRDAGNADGEEEWVPSDSIVEASRLDTVAPPEPEKPKVIEFDDSNEMIDFMRDSGDWDRYSQGILPKMTVDAPEYAQKLLNNTHDGFVVVDKQRMKVILFDRFGVALRTYGMCCARNYGTKHKRADSRTPEGFFEVEGKYDSTDWLFTDDDGRTSQKKGQFGPRFIRIKTPVSSQIGIHGTCAPWSIGGRSSHGCIRITNENILELVDLVETGMPVIVTPGLRDIAVNEREGYYIPSISTVPGGERAGSGRKERVDSTSEDDSLHVPEHDTLHSSEPEKTESTLRPDSSPRHPETPAREPESPAREPESPDTVVGSLF